MLSLSGFSLKESSPWSNEIGFIKTRRTSKELKALVALRIFASSGSSHIRLENEKGSLRSNWKPLVSPHYWMSAPEKSKFEQFGDLSCLRNKYILEDLDFKGRGKAYWKYKPRRT